MNFRKSPQAWFSDLFGFDEGSLKYEQIKANFTVVNHEHHKLLISKEAPEHEYPVGSFTTPTLQDLRDNGLKVLREQRERSGGAPVPGGIIVEHRAIDDALSLAASHPGAVIQVASQFNTLEFTNPKCIPEHGVTNYVFDNTQGPACALSCGAGTVYRNYFAPGADGKTGQTKDNQLNTLSTLEALLDNANEKYFSVENGYSSAVKAGLDRLNERLANLTQETIEKDYLGSVAVGLHEDVGMTFKDRSFTPQPIEGTGASKVTQVFSSALALGRYCPGLDSEFAPLAKIVLYATYEAALWAGVLQDARRAVATAGDGAESEPQEGIQCSLLSLRDFMIPLILFLTCNVWLTYDLTSLSHSVCSVHELM